MNLSRRYYLIGLFLPRIINAKGWHDYSYIPAQHAGFYVFIAEAIPILIVIGFIVDFWNEWKERKRQKDKKH